MTTTHHAHLCDAPRASGMGRPLKVALLMVVAIGGFYLLREHRSHVAGNWGYLLLLACPLMHLFHDHGGHGDHAAPPGKPADKEQ